MKDRKWYMFTEENDNEGETFSFFLLLTDSEFKKLNELILSFGEYDCPYSLPERDYWEREVDFTCGLPDSNGYMSRYKKHGEIKSLPDKIDWEQDDPFYKGLFFD